MNAKRPTQTDKCSRSHWPFRRPPPAWLPTFALRLLGSFLTARAQDPWLNNLNYPMDMNVSLGGTVSFRVYASTTNGPPTLQWQHEGTNLLVTTIPFLVVTNVTMTDAGAYVAWITNASENFTNGRTATLTVDPTFTKITTGPGDTKSTSDYSIQPTWWDYNNDGFSDLFISSGFSWASEVNRLYHNNRDGTFTRVTNVISATLGLHLAASLADYDNDGNDDLFVAVWGGAPELYRNDGAGVFTRLTRQEVGPLLDSGAEASDAAWADYDRDGFLDLFRAYGAFLAVNFNF